jgi:MFS superfamily sulfate permease-like transporter
MMSSNHCHAGAKTQISCFITGIIVMFVLLFLTPVFELMPYSVMGAIIISGVMALFEYETAIYLFRVSHAAFPQPPHLPFTCHAWDVCN